MSEYISVHVDGRETARIVIAVGPMRDDGVRLLSLQLLEVGPGPAGNSGYVMATANLGPDSVDKLMRALRPWSSAGQRNRAVEGTR